ncbi:MAG TPA: glycosyltransferase [Bryobacteraceae bacterium]
MKRKVLLVSSANPYPVVTSGCERLVNDYESGVFSAFDVYFLAAQPETWAPLVLFREGAPVMDSNFDELPSHDFAFVFFVGFKSNDFTRRLAAALPSFCLTDHYPNDDLPDGVFQGILSHRLDAPREDVLLCGGSYNSRIFYPDRQTEDIVLCVGRIHQDKNQLELVTRYADRIYRRHGLPLYLAGGVDDREYYSRVRAHIDGKAIQSTVDPARPDSADGWCTSQQIARLCNRARFFVTASPRESFGIALTEALACGTTCVLNGCFTGFNPAELEAHVYGNIRGKRGEILDLLHQAFNLDIRRDGSEWVKKYSLESATSQQMGFIQERLRKR